MGTTCLWELKEARDAFLKYQACVEIEENLRSLESKLEKDKSELIGLSKVEEDGNESHFEERVTLELETIPHIE